MRQNTTDFGSSAYESAQSNEAQQKFSHHPKGISSLEALTVYRDVLSSHERKEVLKYDKVSSV